MALVAVTGLSNSDARRRILFIVCLINSGLKTASLRCEAARTWSCCRRRRLASPVRGSTRRRGIRETHNRRSRAPSRGTSAATPGRDHLSARPACSLTAIDSKRGMISRIAREPDPVRSRRGRHPGGSARSGSRRSRPRHAGKCVMPGVFLFRCLLSVCILDLVFLSQPPV